MKITYDRAANAAYIQITDQIEAGSVARTIAVNENDGPTDSFNLDLDNEGKLLGIEVLSARSQLAAKVLEAAEIIG